MWKNLKQLCGFLYLSFIFKILYHMGITLQYYFNRIMETIAEIFKKIKSQEQKWNHGIFGFDIENYNFISVVIERASALIAWF